MTVDSKRLGRSLLIRIRLIIAVVAIVIASRSVATAQASNSNGDDHSAESEDAQTPPADDHSEHHSDGRSWSFGADGVLYGTFDKQTGLRGSNEFVSQNWVMGMAARPLGPGQLTLTGMLTAEPLTVGPAGYAELLQEGEAYQNLQVTDRQHPHDFFMQLAGSWRAPLGHEMSLVLAGGPVGEAALGPVAFMHRPSSADNPTAPLSHHIFDSTHIANGVVLVGVNRGPFSIDGSVFNGREPDQHRYRIELGALDSWSVRGWFRPDAHWIIQASHGFLRQPEQLEPGNQRRTNGSASWFQQRPSGFTAITAAVGETVRNYSTVHAVLVEGTHEWRGTSVYSRFEAMTAETEILLFPEVVHRPHPGELVDPIQEVTVGAVRHIGNVGSLSVGVGGDVVLYGLPSILQFVYGPSPRGFHLFVQLRPAARGSQMWNATMGQPMDGHLPMQHDMSHMTQ